MTIEISTGLEAGAARFEPSGPAALLALGAVVALPFLNNLGISYDWSYPKLFALQTATALALCAVLLSRAGGMRELFAASGLGKPMAALLAWAALSVFWSRSPWAAVQPLVELSWLALGVVAFSVLLGPAQSRRWFVLAYGISAAAACVGYAAGHVAGNQPFMEVYPFANPNTAAAFAIAPLAAGASYAISAAARRLPPAAGIVGAAVAAAAAMAVAASRSAAGAAASAGALLLVGVFCLRGRARRITLEVIGVIVLLAVLWPVLAPELWPVEWLGEHFGVRPVIWQGAARLARERPLIGFGVGSFPVEYTRFYPLEYAAHKYRSDMVETAHSLPIHVVAELGLAGAALAAWLFARAVAAARRAAADADNEQRVLLRGAVCGALGMLAQAAVSTELHYVESNINLVLALAVIGGLCRRSGAQRPGAEPPRMWPRAAAAAVVAALYLATAATGLASQFYLHRAVTDTGDHLALRVELLRKSIAWSWPNKWMLDARLKLAQAYEQAGYREEAMAHLRVLDRLAPNVGPVRLLQANLALQLGQLREAAEAISSYATKDPFDRRAYEIWTALLERAVAAGTPDLARPREAVRLLSVAEEWDTTRLPREEARKLKRRFLDAVGAKTAAGRRLGRRLRP